VALHDWSSDLERTGRERARRRRRRRAAWISAAAVVVAVLAVAAAILVPRVWYDTPAYQKSVSLGPYAGQLTPEVKAELQALLPQLERFVAERRGAPYPHRVKVVYLPDWRFLDALDARARNHGGVSTGLGFYLNSGNHDAQVRLLQEQNIAAFYDTRANNLYVRGDSFGEWEQFDLVHELTRAYDDQRFGLDGTPQFVSDDRSAARRSLVEGDAMTVERAFVDTLPSAWSCLWSARVRQPFDAGCRRAGYGNSDAQLPDVDTVRIARQAAPYEAGAAFVRALISHGGEGEVDAAFRHQPTSTAQIIEPDRFLARDEPVAVTPPPGRGRTGVLGAFAVSDLLAHGEMRIDGADYLRGWAGDAYRATHHGCFTDRLVLTGAAAADRAQTQFARWSAARRHRAFDRVDATTFQFSTCEPALLG
jgi:hypothetical protein